MKLIKLKIVRSIRIENHIDLVKMHFLKFEKFERMYKKKTKSWKFLNNDQKIISFHSTC